MDTIQQYDSLLRERKVVILVFFRGHWCPFCMSYLKQLQKLAPSIEQAGGRILAVTSQPADQIEATRQASGFQGKLLSDPANSLAAELSKRGLLNVAITEKKGYSHGMAQPAILAVTSDQRVVYKWACVPSMSNFGGAKDRPDLVQMWNSVDEQLKGGNAKVVDEKGFGFISMISMKVT